MRCTFLSLFCFITLFASAQKLKKEDKQIIANLQQHEQFLASDKLEGRRTGSAGAQLAAEYISNQFKTIGLLPKGNNEYLQPFDVNDGKQILPTTFLQIDENVLQLDKDYFPLVYSANASLEAMPSISLPEPKMPRFLDLKEMLEENKNNPHYDLSSALKEKIKATVQKGGTALFIYNTSEINDGISFEEKDRSEVVSIPVVYISKGIAQKYFADPSASLDIKLKTAIGSKTRTGKNVIGYVDNGAATTVILGAHFDHLGYGEDHNSRYTGSDKQIHNGADDNASGTSALIELARVLKSSKAKNNNYLFIAFSGEELGLYGSKYFVNHPTVDLSAVNYMINMDMVGRLNDSSNTITIGGYGTSPEWGATFAAKGKNSLYAGPLVYRFDSSGTGPSDHTSFYLKNIPVLFYFTGLHTDYHKPSDDFDKINYVGELYIIKNILSLVENRDKQNIRLAFTKTREQQTATSARFSVSLGIMPDYTFSGAGVRADGVSDNKPAQKAGLKTGDVIVSLGDYSVTSMESYMQALSKFKKGDKTTVIYVRGAEKLSTTVEF
jgi:hypothetical protein